MINLSKQYGRQGQGHLRSKSLYGKWSVKGQIVGELLLLSRWQVF